MPNSRLNDAFRFASYLNAKKIINAAITRSSYYYSQISGKIVHRGFPYFLSVEPTNTCNLHCLECPTGQKILNRTGGYVDVHIFKKIINEVQDHLISLILYFQGEPLLHKKFPELVSFAHKKNIYTITSTNAHFLNDENCKSLVESGLDRLIISYDGTTQDAYSAYRKNGDLKMVERGIENMLLWKKKLGKSNPYIILQFLVLGVNEHQIKEAINNARKWKLPVHLKSAQIYDTEKNKYLVPLNTRYARYLKQADGKYAIKKKIKNPCFRMWSGAVITWDAKMVLCCFDKNAEYIMGDPEQKPIKEIWKSNKYNDFRSKVLADRKRIEMCRNCTE